MKTPHSWLVHSYQNPPAAMPHKEAKRLLKQYGGSYNWLGDVCHVYLLPWLETTVRQRGQDELDLFKRIGRTEF